MSSLATLIKDDSLSSTLRIGFVSLAACSVVGLAAYVGYRAAGPQNKTYALQNRHPESNEQVNKNHNDEILYDFDRFCYFLF